MEPLSRNKRLGLSSLVLLIVVGVGLFLTGNLSFLGLKSATLSPFIVTFDSGNSAKAPTTKSVISPATTVGTLPANPVKTGYTFGGWYTAVSGGGTQFTATTPVTASIRVYAQWIPVPAPFTVTFDSGNSAKTPIKKSVTPPATTVGTLPTNPVKTGYTFGGWYTAVNGGGTQFTATTPVTANIIVYAQWTPVPAPFTVTYDSGGAKIHSQKSVTPPATTVGTLPANPVKTGYTFGGWYTATNGGGTQFTATTPVTASIRVYAKWIAK